MTVDQVFMFSLLNFYSQIICTQTFYYTYLSVSGRKIEGYFCYFFIIINIKSDVMSKYITSNETEEFDLLNVQRRQGIFISKVWKNQEHIVLNISLLKI